MNDETPALRWQRLVDILFLCYPSTVPSGLNRGSFSR